MTSSQARLPLQIFFSLWSGKYGHTLETSTILPEAASLWLSPICHKSSLGSVASRDLNLPRSAAQEKPAISPYEEAEERSHAQRQRLPQKGRLRPREEQRVWSHSSWGPAPPPCPARPREAAGGSWKCQAGSKLSPVKLVAARLQPFHHQMTLLLVGSADTARTERAWPAPRTSDLAEPGTGRREHLIPLCHHHWFGFWPLLRSNLGENQLHSFFWRGVRVITLQKSGHSCFQGTEHDSVNSS